MYNIPPNANSNMMNWRLPQRIILVCHVESDANTDEKLYRFTPNHEIPLSSEEFLKPFKQDFGNFRPKNDHEEESKKYGTFFYRFPSGESAADVYDRVSNFLESLWRDIDMNRLSKDTPAELMNIVIVSHDESIRVFLMRWFKWSTEQFESLTSPETGKIRVMELGASGEYSLAIRHTDETLKAWGLSDEMIEDQKQRANDEPGTYVPKGKSPSWYLKYFFGSADSVQKDQVTKRAKTTEH
ncbi:OLC1v1000562C1 [Oldenlandia corymbosa var. corymbosa]|uniref:OLC1v1000562C1 n=1 Tax=Oldenlandia corymbosa var. corymbosa TaxID=529605 RepID=A0AAV1D350_OLDCO|nr:OLC1v1000562C1 [Oldenlandia corymbosa var. corymbosa]